MSTFMPIASFLAAFLVLFPLPAHWRARNIPTLSVITWLFLVNVAHGVNTIAWAGNVDLKLLVWCDIAIRLDIGSNLALPAACFRLCMHLESVASIRTVRTTSSDKRRRMVVDLIVCVALPLLYIAAFYIVQGHRFDIVEDFGCHAEDYVSVPEFFIVWLLPIIFALGTFIFAGLSFYHFFRRRANFAKHLASTNSALTPGRYFRLMSMSLVEMFWTVLIIACTLSYNYSGGLRPWTNWDDVHSNWLNVNRFPRFIIPQKSLRWTYFLWWATPISTFFFIVFFAFTQEAMREYSSYIQWIRRVIFHQTSRALEPSRSAILPVSAPKLPIPITVSISETKSKDTFSMPTASTTKVAPFTSFDSRSFTDSVLSYDESHSHPDVPEDVIVSPSSDGSRPHTPPLSSCYIIASSGPPPSPPPQARLGDESNISPTLRYAPTLDA